MIRIGSLFSGYGGLDLAVQSVLGGEIAWHVEYDKAPSRILDHHFPGVPNYGDVTKLDFTSVEPVDVLTGGYPCQPFSHAGLRKGTDDDRHLWPHVLRAIREMGPRLAILENVRGHLTLGFDSVLADLADVGWSARWGVVRASDAGAPHQRARLFIIAYPSSNAGGERRGLSSVGRWSDQAEQVGLGDWGNAAYPDGGRREQPDQGKRLLQLPDQDSHGTTADAAGDGRPQGRARSGQWTGSAGQPSSHLSPTTDADSVGLEYASLTMAGQYGVRAASGHRDSAADTARSTRGRQEQCDLPAPQWASESRERIAWGDYGPAIARWERVIGRPAPAPTEPRRSGAPRLSPAFVEWMMGLPPGWVTDPSIGISRNDQLKALGNGVVPQQAALALDVLLKGTADDFTQSFATV